VLDGVFFGIWELLFGIMVLYLSLGPVDLDAQVEDLVDAWESDDQDEVREIAGDIMGEVPAVEPGDMASSVIQAILVEANLRLIGPLLWFVVLGPIGAALFRLACILDDQSDDEDFVELGAEALRLRNVLAWVPARLSALAYAITGSFVDALHNWRERSGKWADDWQASVDEVLVAAGSGALRLDRHPLLTATGEFDRDAALEEIREANGLVRRSVILLVAVLALMTLSGWAA
jgi:membrane protein required for beta-lactamase induction